MMYEDGHVILRYRDGRIERATAADVDTTNERLNATLADDSAKIQVAYEDLKAVFFPRVTPDEELPEPQGSLIAVEFDDGEVIRGNATFDPSASGFFLTPLDRSKNERIFVVRSAIASIEVERL